jgi:hypothetical protein
MAKQPNSSLRQHLDNLLRMKGAHLTFHAAVTDFPVALRGAKPPGVPHSAWQLIEHMRIAQQDILDFSRNPPSEASWDASVQQFQSDLKELKTLIADTKNDLLAAIPHGSGQTLLREALVVADHNSYHLGQLMFLRKMLEAEPRRG